MAGSEAGMVGGKEVAAEEVRALFGWQTGVRRWSCSQSDRDL